MSAANQQIAAPWERDDFPSADAKFAALIAGGGRDRLPIVVDGLSGYDMQWTVSEAEIAVFGLQRTCLPALYWSYCRYECLMGTVDEHFGEFADAERQTFAAYVARGDNVEDAADFMAATTGLRFAQCLGWALKVRAADLRGGLYSTTPPQCPPFEDDDIPF